MGHAWRCCGREVEAAEVEAATALGIGRSATGGRDERDARGGGAGGGKLDVGLERVGGRGGSRGRDSVFVAAVFVAGDRVQMDGWSLKLKMVVRQRDAGVEHP